MQYPKTVEKFERFWQDGMLKWPGKKIKVEEALIPDPYDLFIDSLVGCNLQSIQSKNKLIVKKNDIILYDFIITEITFVQRQGETLIIKSEDKTPVFLNFISEGECSKALQRALLILNGYEVIKCNDELLYVCSSPKRIGLIFS